ncbi:hypothetical protein BP5796_13229 [Coleophoma crateriformis]|uniref:RTA1-domain-containing protein n=1 Tax=Coleophoma crateriformis TaxID=565419 RepID=A0A3D8Q4M3_9HELO|nr:hypothetical protein BP5796_13229 [Coleophoma crateriformis]
MDITLIESSQGNITGVVYFTYTPSLSAAYGFMGMFAVMTIAHFMYMFPLRSWYFVSFILGGICETFGYYGRTECNKDITKTGPWMLQNILILGAPTFLAATVYMTLARLTVALGAEEHAMISPRWLTKLYVLIDIICFLSQFAGAAVQASGNQQVIAIGNKVILGGLVFQLVAFAFFLLMAWRISVGFAKRQENFGDGRHLQSGWRKYFWALYTVSVLFIVRNLVRAVEYAQQASSGGFSFATRTADGTLHYLTKHTATLGDNEIYLYIFDATMMFLVALTFLLVHPARLIKRARTAKGEKLLSMETGVTTG